MGEYIPEYWQIITWLTGFTGSAATIIITNSFAGLWTDSRYFIQAEKQLAGSGFEFVKPGAFQRNDYMDFVCENSEPGNKIGIDGRIFSIAQFKKDLKRGLKVKRYHLRRIVISLIPSGPIVPDCLFRWLLIILLSSPERTGQRRSVR